MVSSLGVLYLGWSLGNIDMDDANLRHICVDLRISIINVDYR